MLGYDLLNEPLPNEWQHRYADELVALYRDLTAAIREIDPRPPHHVRGHRTGRRNWSIFTEVWDENSVLQFHKYWSPRGSSRASRRSSRPATASACRSTWARAARTTSSGCYAAFRLYEAHGIGWNLWPWKKVETLTSPASVVAPERWDDVIGSIGGEPRLTRDEARAVLDELLDAVAIDRCLQRPEVVAAITADRPDVIPAWAYGFAGAGESFASAADPAVPNLRVDDSVALRFAFDEPHPENPFEHRAGAPFRSDERIVVDLAAGDWLVFDVDAETDAAGYLALGPDREPVPVSRRARGTRHPGDRGSADHTRLARRRWRRIPLGSLGRS